MPKNRMCLKSLLEKKEYNLIIKVLKKKKSMSVSDMRKEGIDLIPQRLNEKLVILSEQGYISRSGKPRYFKYTLTNKYWIWEFRNDINKIIDKYENLVV